VIIAPLTANEQVLLMLLLMLLLLLICPELSKKRRQRGQRSELWNRKSLALLRPETLIEKGVGGEIGFVSDVVFNVVLLTNNPRKLT